MKPITVLSILTVALIFIPTHARLSRIIPAAQKLQQRVKLRDLFGNEQWVTADRAMVQDANLYPVFKPHGYDDYAGTFFTRVKHALTLRKQGYSNDDIVGLSSRGQHIYYAAVENNPRALAWYLKNTNPTLQEIERPLLNTQVHPEIDAILKKAAHDRNIDAHAMATSE